MKIRSTGFLTTIVAFILAAGLLSSPAAGATINDLPDLSALNEFAIFGNILDLTSVTINGHVGVPASGSISLKSGSTVNGDIFLGLGVTRSLNGQYHALHEPMDLSLPRGTIFSAATALAAMTPDATYVDWTSGLTIPGHGGLWVINVTGDVDLTSESITLTGGLSDIFLINIFGSFTLNGTGGIVAGNGIDASHVLINVVGPGNEVKANVNSVVDGTIFVPNRQMQFYSVTGGIYGGDQEIKLLPGSMVDHVPFHSPEPATLTLLALAGLAVLRRRPRGSAAG